MKFLNEHSQVIMLNSSQNLNLKEVKHHSLNLISLIDTGSQHAILKKGNFNKIKDYVKLEAIDMYLTFKDTGSR